jgi:hypothetical protein
VSQGKSNSKVVSLCKSDSKVVSRKNNKFSHLNESNVSIIKAAPDGRSSTLWIQAFARNPVDIITLSLPTDLIFNNDKHNSAINDFTAFTS